MVPGDNNLTKDQKLANLFGLDNVDLVDNVNTNPRYNSTPIKNTNPRYNQEQSLQPEGVADKNKKLSDLFGIENSSFDDEVIETKTQLTKDQKLADLFGISGPTNEDSNVLVRTALGVKKGWQGFTITQGYDRIMNIEDPELRAAEKMLLDREYSEFEKKWAKAGDLGFWGENIGGVAGGMAKGMAGGVDEGLIGAGAMGLIGQLPGLNFIPEEFVTMPWGFSKGMSTGTMMEWKKYGSGEMYKDMIEEGTDHEISKAIADKAGWIYAGIEFMQMNTIMPGAKRIVGNTVKDILKTAVQIYGKDVLSEVTEEGLQAVVVAMSKDIAKAVGEGKSIDEIIGMINNNKGNYTKSFGTDAIASIPTMLVLGGIGTGINTKSAVKSAVKENDRVYWERKKEAPLSEEEAARPGVDDFFTPDELVNEVVQKRYGKDYTPAQRIEVEDKTIGLNEKEPATLEPGAEDFFRLPTEKELRAQAETEYLSGLRTTIKDKIKSQPQADGSQELMDIVDQVPEEKLEEFANNVDEIIKDADLEGQTLLARQADISGKKDAAQADIDPIEFIRDMLPVKTFVRKGKTYEKKLPINVEPNKRGFMPGEFQDFKSERGISFTMKRRAPDGQKLPTFDDLVDRYNKEYNMELTESDVLGLLRDSQMKKSDKKKMGNAKEKFKTGTQVTGGFNTLQAKVAQDIRSAAEGKYITNKVKQEVAPAPVVQEVVKGKPQSVEEVNKKINDLQQRADWIIAKGKEAAEKAVELNGEFGVAVHKVGQSLLLNKNNKISDIVKVTKDIIKGADSELINVLITEVEEDIEKVEYLVSQENFRNTLRQERLNRPKSTKQSYRQQLAKMGIQWEGGTPGVQQTPVNAEVERAKITPAIEQAARDMTLPILKETFADIIEDAGPTNRFVHPSYDQIEDLRLKSEQMFTGMKGWFKTTFSITDSFSSIDASRTGEALRTLQAIIIEGQYQAKQRVADLNDYIQKIEGRSKLEIALIAEGSIDATTQSEQEFRDYYSKTMDESLQELQDNEILEQGLFERMTSTLEADLAKLNAQLKSLNSIVNLPVKNKAEIRKTLQEQIKITKEALLEIDGKDYIPLNTTFTAVFERMLDNKNVEFKPFFDNRSSFASFRKIMGRKTLTLKSLVDEGIVSEGDIDIRESMAYYTAYYKEKIAQKKVIDAAKEDGLMMYKSSKNIPKDFVPASKMMDVPALKNYYLHEKFADYFQESMAGWKYKSNAELYFSRVLSWVKMKAFINPVYMPISDINQVAMSGMLTPDYLRKLPRNTRLALTAMRDHNELYQMANETGALSVIEPNRFQSFKDEVNNMIVKADSPNATMFRASMDYALSVMKNPYEVISDIYTISHNTTWHMDHMIRLITFTQLLEKGMTPTEAGQLTAKIHGDYADVPIAVRKKINKVFFTPTYKVAMGRLYAHAINGVVQVVKKKGNSSASEKQMAKAALLIPGMMLGKHIFMKTVFGADAKEWSWKYTLPSETNSGRAKDINVTFATPYNLVSRYYHRFIAKKPGQWNLVDRFIGSMSYELHPLYQSVLRLGMNRDHDGKEIMVPYSSDGEKIVDASKFLLTNTIRLIDALNLTPSQSDTELKEALANSGYGTVLKLMRMYTFQYASDPALVETSRKLQRELRNFKNSVKYGIEAGDKRYMDDKKVEGYRDNLLKVIDENIKGL